MEIKLNSLIPELYVRNIKISLEFYKIIGFKILYQRENENFVFLELQNSQIMLEELNKNSWVTGAMEIPFGRGVNFQIRILDVERLYEMLIQKNITIYKTIYEKSYFIHDRLYKQKQFLIQEPDGYLLRFFQSIESDMPSRLEMKMRNI